MTDPDKTFILPIFIKPGRTHFILRTQSDARIKDKIDKGGRVRIKNYQRREDAHFSFYYNRHIVLPRAEKVPACKFGKNISDMNLTIFFTLIDHKVLKLPENVEKFDKASSVFSNWRRDDKLTIEKCLNNDFGNWKVDRFVKNGDDMRLM